MGLRFRKSFKVAPGVRLNVSKSGVSSSVGIRGVSVSIGGKGTHANLGLPGTGLSIRTRLSGEDKAVEHEDKIFIKTKLVGVTHKNKDGVNRQHILQQMKTEGKDGEQITFMREPDNPKDPNAVMILNSDGACLGYLNARLAADVAACLAEYPESVLYGKILNFTGGTDDAPNIGCNIAIMTNEQANDDNDNCGVYHLIFIIVSLISPLTWLPALLFKSFKAAGIMFCLTLLICECSMLCKNNDE